MLIDKINNMTKLELFNKLITTAKANGYEGPDGQHIGHIIDGTNAYSIFFREDFAIAIWGDGESLKSFGSGLHASSKSVPRWEIALCKLASSKDKWKFMEQNVNFD